jgi:hypothetical protein
MEDLQFPVFALTAGFPRLSIDPSSVMSEILFESTAVGAIALLFLFVVIYRRPCGYFLVFFYQGKTSGPFLL